MVNSFFDDIINFEDYLAGHWKFSRGYMLLLITSVKHACYFVTSGKDFRYSDDIASHRSHAPDTPLCHWRHLSISELRHIFEDQIDTRCAYSISQWSYRMELIHKWTGLAQMTETCEFVILLQQARSSRISKPFIRLSSNISGRSSLVRSWWCRRRKTSSLTNTRGYRRLTWSYQQLSWPPSWNGKIPTPLLNTRFHTKHGLRKLSHKQSPYKLPCSRATSWHLSSCHFVHSGSIAAWCHNDPTRSSSVGGTQKSSRIVM